MGLLDSGMFDNEQMRLGMGLLAAGGARSDGANFGQRLMEGLGSVDQWKQGKQRQKLQDMQMKEAEAAVADKEAQRAEQTRIKTLLANFGRPMGGTNLINDALPKDMQIGALTALSAPMDYQALIRQGVPLETVKALAESRNFGRDKVARTAEIEGPNGSKLVQGYDDYGLPVGQGANGYIAPQLIDQGDRKTFAKPMIGQSFGMGMSPEARDSSARGWAGVNQSAARLAFDKAGGSGGKAPAGYRFLPDGNMEAIPGGPADIKAGQAGAQKATDAREALSVISEAEKLIPQSTGSGIGSMVDSAAGFFGASPKGAQAGARLKALEGMLVSKMPKMSGPQSDKDVLLYKQMAGQVGDTSLPVASRMAALETIKGIQMRYGSTAQTQGASGGWSIQKAD